MFEDFRETRARSRSRATRNSTELSNLLIFRSSPKHDHHNIHGWCFWACRRLWSICVHNARWIWYCVLSKTLKTNRTSSKTAIPTPIQTERDGKPHVDFRKTAPLDGGGDFRRPVPRASVTRRPAAGCRSNNGAADALPANQRLDRQSPPPPQHRLTLTVTLRGRSGRFPFHEVTGGAWRCGTDWRYHRHAAATPRRI